MLRNDNKALDFHPLMVLLIARMVILIKTAGFWLGPYRTLQSWKSCFAQGLQRAEKGRKNKKELVQVGF